MTTVCFPMPEPTDWCRVGQRLPGSSRFAREFVAWFVAWFAMWFSMWFAMCRSTGGIRWRVEFGGGWS
ncbi:hypothetical protein KGQ19_29935, partial [Catenulispora sp. NL8]